MLTAHGQTIATVIGSAGTLATLGGLAVRAIKKPLTKSQEHQRKTAEVLTTFFGEPADVVLGKPERVPLMVQLGQMRDKVMAIADRVEDVDAGNVEIIRRQGLQDERLRAVESKVGQTLTAVRSA